MHSALGRKRFRDDDSPYSSPDRPERQFRRLNDRQRGRAPRRDDKHELSYDDVFKRNLWDAADPRHEESKPASFHFGRGDHGLVHLAKAVADMWYSNSALVCAAFRSASTELPHKLDHYAALLSVLAFEPSKDTRGAGWDDESVSESKETGPSIASAILTDLIKSLQSNVDTRQWRSVRFQMQLFSSLASLPTSLISPSSLYSILNSFASVLDEPNVKSPRAAEFVHIIAASLFRFTNAEDYGAEQLVSTLNSYSHETPINHSAFLVDEKNASKIHDPLQTTVAALGRGFPLLPSRAEQVLRDADLEDKYFAKSDLPGSNLELPALLVPSDDPESLNQPENDKKPLDQMYESRGYYGVHQYPKIFEDDTVPDRLDPAGIVLRTLVIDIIDVFSINRKECARMLLNLRTFSLPWSNDDENDPKSPWILEHIIIESILSMLLASPEPRHKHVYYHTLITELCRISPTTVAPAMGKSVRRLYSGLGAQQVSDATTIILDPEGIRRFVDWFALHLSNYGYQWRWKEWESDLRESQKNDPKFVFVSRTLELENRLSYHDRIKSTIPESFIDELHVFPAEPSSISFEFESEEHPHREVATEFIRLIREKATMEDLKSDIENFKQKLKESDQNEETAIILAYQCLLYVGSRSLSHLLNALERYISLFRWLVSDNEKKLLLLTVVSDMWPSSQQMLFITIDKLLQYRIIDPGTLIKWIFRETAAAAALANAHTQNNGIGTGTGTAADAMDTDSNINDNNNSNNNNVDSKTLVRAKIINWSNLTVWDLLKSALDRSKSRVEKLSARLKTLRSEETNKKASEDATNDDESNNPENSKESSSTELENAEKQVAVFATDYRKAFVDVARYFHSQLKPSSTASESERQELDTWWLHGWFKHFCRSYATDIKTHKSDIDSELASLEPNELLNDWLSKAVNWANDQ